MFNFKTTATINFNIKFIKSCLFEGTAKSEGYKTSEEDMKFSVYENMKNACEKQSKKFVEMFTQISSDHIRKSLHKYKGEVDVEVIEENVENVEDKIATILLPISTAVKARSYLRITFKVILAILEPSEALTCILNRLQHARAVSDAEKKILPNKQIIIRTIRKGSGTFNQLLCYICNENITTKSIYIQ
jgi:tyrosyl-tRNA synthetase